VLSEADNQLLTRVGPGTPMGELMRRYWHPIAAVSELEAHPTKAVRLLGEDLVIYKDRSGRYGILDRHCPHRRADLSYGYVEEHGLRCSYHGWLFGEGGQCLAQPYDDIAYPQLKFKDKVRIKAYKLEAKAGLLWAYLGPDPAPLVPNWEPFTWENGFVQIVYADIPCNWVQCQENSIDPVHFEWLHANWGIAQQAFAQGQAPTYAPRHLQLKFEEFDHGFIYRRIREDTDENHELWTTGRVCLWPNALFTGGHFEWRVPVDDNNTLSVTWAFNRVPKDREPFQQTSIPAWRGPIRDPRTDRWISSHIMNQDFIGWVGQGTVADRTQEHLGMSDRGIVMLRKRFTDDLKAIAAGGDPKGLVRDPKLNECIQIPLVGRERLRNGITREQLNKRHFLKAYIFQAGQPKEVREAFRAAMGLTDDEIDQAERVALGAELRGGSSTRGD
jgi:5,5'-dehydrodivanillate O-demethylase oxygenase subunit